MNHATRTLLQACRLYDKVVAFKHWLSGSESKHIQFYSQFVNNGDLCFDIGANVGRRTEVLLKLNASVVAVEPKKICINILKKKYGNNSDVILVEQAVGEKTGQAEMMLSNAHSLSSLSKLWISTVKSSGRHGTATWSKKMTVPVTTLDSLISEYGKPDFIKIDVEGYEYQTLKGLSQPVKYICFEFISELIDITIKCIEHLDLLGPAKFNYACRENETSLALQHWLGCEQMREVLLAIAANGGSGDIFAMFDT